jgi:hypothetical protein
LQPELSGQKFLPSLFSAHASLDLGEQSVPRFLERASIFPVVCKVHRQQSARPLLDVPDVCCSTPSTRTIDFLFRFLLQVLIPVMFLFCQIKGLEVSLHNLYLHRAL